MKNTQKTRKNTKKQQKTCFLHIFHTPYSLRPSKNTKKHEKTRFSAHFFTIIKNAYFNKKQY